MKILMYGAGVIGTLYGAQLQEAGHRVTVLARNQRLADIREHGLILENIVTSAQSMTSVGTVGRLGPEDDYDLAIITVRRDQLAQTLPELAANKRIPSLLFMLNNPTGSANLAEALGPERVIRNGRCQPPPVQIPACAANAPGSSLGFWRRSGDKAAGVLF
jgi:2-dehydropantoate 2-reductase